MRLDWRLPASQDTRAWLQASWRLVNLTFRNTRHGATMAANKSGCHGTARQIPACRRPPPSTATAASPTRQPDTPLTAESAPLPVPQRIFRDPSTATEA
jgi:hypothetical protein